jgi:hypothetical protein
MNRFLKIFAVLAVLLSLGAAANVEYGFLKSDFGVAWRPDLDGIQVGIEGLTECKNMRPDKGALEGIAGYSHINNTALTTYTGIRALHQFWSEGRTNESYLLAHVAHGTTPASYASKVYLNKTEPDGTGDFEATVLHTDASNNLAGMFSEWPIGVAYTNGEESYQYWGEEGPIGGFFTLSDVSLTEDDFVFSGSTCTTTNGNFLDEGFKAWQTVTISGGANDGNTRVISAINAAGTQLTFTVAPSAETLGTDQTIYVNDRKIYTDAVDYTNAVSNSLQTSGNTVDTYGGLDSNTILLIHADGSPGDSITDSGTTGHTITKNGNADISNDAAKWSTGSVVFDGAGDSISAPDHADWNFGTNEFCLETWVNFDTVSDLHTIYFQSDGDEDYDHVWLFYDGLRDKVYFQVVSSSGTVQIHEEASWSPSISTWYHVAVIRGWGGGANDWAITVDGAAIGTFTASVTMPNLATGAYFGWAYSGATLDYSGQYHPTAFWGTSDTTSTYKWGTGGLELDGDSDYVTLPDSTDWDIAGSNTGSKTVEFWVKHTDHVGTEPYINQYESGADYWLLDHVHGTGFRFIVGSGGVQVLSLTGGEITDTDWHHVAVVIVGNGSTKDVGIYLDGVQTAHTQDNSVDTFATSLVIGAGYSNYFDGQMDEVRIYDGNPFSAAPDAGLTDTITVPTAAHTADANTKLLLHSDVTDFDGYMDEVRVSDTARWTSTFSAPDRAYKVSQDRLRVFSIRPLKAIKFYVSKANTTASTLSGYVWGGRSFSTLSITDGTASGSISMAQTGTVEFGDTYDSAEPIHFEGTYLYCYEFELSAGGCEIYQVTADAGFSPVNDIWTGEKEPPLEVRFWDASAGAYIDYTLFANSTSSDGTPYGLVLDQMTTSDHILLGFEQRVSAVDMTMLTDYVNTNAATASVGYWGGTQWVDTGAVADNSQSDLALKTLGQSGLISWYPPAESDEKLYNPFGTPLYFYKITVSATLSGTSGGDEEIVADLITGVPAQYEIEPTVGAGVFKSRALRYNFNASSEGNRIDYSVTNAPNSWNGDDSSMNGVQALYIGDGREITKTSEIYNRVGSNLKTILTVTKKRSISIVDGDGPEDFRVFPVSYNVGCPAPDTFVTIEMGYEIAQDVIRNVQMWMDYSGFAMFDSAFVRPIPGLDNYFDPNATVHVDWDNIDDSWAIYDPQESDYIVCFPLSNSSYFMGAYNLIEKKWFEIVPASYPSSAAAVEDGNGIRYTYLGMSDGYVNKWNDTPAWAGQAIAYSWATGDFIPSGNEYDVTRIDYLKLITAETAEDLNITVQHYADTESSANSDTAVFPLDSASSIRLNLKTEDVGNWVGTTHKLRFSVTAGNGAGAAANAVKVYRQNIAWTLDERALRE